MIARKFLLSAALGTSLALGGTGFATLTNAPAAVAAPKATGSIVSSIPCTIAGVASTCDLNVTSIDVVDGVLTATGTVTGGTVAVPFAGAPLDLAGTCPILDLTLGPLHLDLLGLVVDLDTVDLSIIAQSGPGNLLGNLLCAVSHLLDGPGIGAGLQNLLNLINGILSNL